ncbi:hypothetical protein GCM10027435_04530 [Haloparvum alkalitolerans]|uniref:sugar phosphate isomerase/epimerase family protein n=1 Tax=Haloparvum alkalitolerans TaxID=1042953 RepID=UPI003CF11FFE
MNVERGVVTQPDNDVAGYFEVADAVGLDYVEVMLDGATDREWLSGEGRELLERYDDLGLAVHLPFEGLDLGSPFDGVREAVVAELHACHRAADRAGADTAVLHPTALAWERAHGGARLAARVERSIEELDARAAEAGLDATLSVENVYDALVATDDVPGLLAGTDASMTFDTGHARIDGHDDAEMARFLAAHADRVSHLHLNDTRTAADEHLPLGAGSIDFARLFSALPDGWTGSASVEVTTPNMAYVERSARHLDELLASTR